MTNIESMFNKLIEHMYIRYKGCLIERTEGKFKALNKLFDTEEAAKQCIDRQFLDFSKNIVK